MVSELPLPGLSRRRTRRLCEGASDFKQTRSVVKCEHRVCVVQTTPTSTLPSRLSGEKQDLLSSLLLLLLLPSHADRTVLGSEEGTHTKQSQMCTYMPVHACKHTHTHTQSLLMAFFLNTNTFHPHVSCELVHAVSSASQQIPAARRCVYVFVQAE